VAADLADVRDCPHVITFRFADPEWREFVFEVGSFVEAWTRANYAAKRGVWVPVEVAPPVPHIARKVVDGWPCVWVAGAYLWRAVIRNQAGHIVAVVDPIELDGRCRVAQATGRDYVGASAPVLAG
jgi:hypothetical protein